MSRGKKYKTPAKYLHKRIGKVYHYWRVGEGKSGKYSFKHIRRSKYFKSLDAIKLSMLKLWKRELWFWN